MPGSQKEEILQYFSGDKLSFYEHYLPDLQKNGKEYVATCINHNDSQPSLSVNPETGEFYCFGEKSGGDIFTFYAKQNGLSCNGQFPQVCQGIIDKFNIPVSPQKKEPTPKGKPTKTHYSYRDPITNQVLFEKVRIEYETGEKSFYIRHKDSSGAWQTGIGNKKRVLYRLPAISKAKEICLTEGEKDADNVSKLKGFTATTNFDGAGKWRDDYNEPLKGKTIFIFPDNDKEGKEHAALVASKLHGIAKTVKIIELPDLKEKQDISDFINRFNDAETAGERLSILIDNAPPYEPAKIYTLKDAILPVEKFAALETTEKQYHLKPWLKNDSINLVTGDRGVGKTWAAIGIVSAVSSGENFGPWECESPADCLYLDGEMTVSDNKERIKLLKLTSNRSHKIHYYADAFANSLGLPKARLDSAHWRAEVKALLIDLDVDLWVIDNIASLAPGLDENVKQDWDPINQWFLELRFAGISSILLHHTNKAGGQRGTSAREDNIDISILLQPPTDYLPEEGARFIFHFSKQRISHKYLSFIGDTEFRLNQNLSGYYEWHYRNVKRPSKQQVIKRLSEGETKAEIAKATNLSAGYISKIKTQAVKDGYLTKKCSLTEPGKVYVSGV
jgi:putative DNA primase/helicase